MNDRTPAKAPTEGVVIPAGHTLGIPARLADDANACDAYAALVAAGHTPAELSPEGDDDEYGDDPAQGTGFRIDVRDDGRVLVYHLVRGVDAWHALSDGDRRAALSLYRIALRAAGWECDPYLTRAVHARRTPMVATPAPAAVEAPAAAARYEVRTVSAHLHGVWSLRTEMWAATGALGVCRDIADDLNAGRLEVDAFGRVVRPEEPAPDMPTLEGHRFTVTADAGRTVIRMYADGQAAPVFEDWTYHPSDADVVPMIAREMARVQRNRMKETAALLALDDATLYQVATSAGDVETMTGAAARARLQVEREKAGPEKLHSRNTPRVTLEHSGARWLLTVHAYKGGNHDFRNNLRIVVVPQVTADAGEVLGDATGDGWLLPVEKPSAQAFGAWVRPVPERPDMVVVHRVACGLHQRPEHEPARSRWDEHMTAYRAALEAAGWKTVNPCADWADGGMVFLAPERTA